MVGKLSEMVSNGLKGPGSGLTWSGNGLKWSGNCQEMAWKWSGNGR